MKNISEAHRNSATRCSPGKVFCLNVGKCINEGLCNNQDRSLWNDKNGYKKTSSADSFNRQQYYCPPLNAYVTNKKSCEVMSKLSGNSQSEDVGELKFSCEKGTVSNCIN